jgi:hypothetical protein
MNNAELNYIMAEFKPIADSIKEFTKKHGFNHLSITDYGKINMLELSVFHEIPDDSKHFYVDNFLYKEKEIRKETLLLEHKEA